MKGLREITNSLSGIRSLDANPQEEFPINVSDDTDWEILESPERLRRVYEFDNQKIVLYFVNELYKYQFEIHHHCTIIVKNLHVVIETYTHDYNGITELDKKIKKMADSLYEDVVYFENE